MQVFEAINGRTLVLPINTLDATASGILLGSTRKEIGMRGTVVSSSSESYVNVGDVVCYGELSGTKFKINGVVHLILRKNDVLLKIVNND